jgi:glycosyltransferase involved in cell wall biosynthesis
LAWENYGENFLEDEISITQRFMRILFLSNIPTPYQLDFFDEVSVLEEVCGVFLWGREDNRDWNLAQKPWLRILSSDNKKIEWKQLYKLLIEFRPDRVLVGGYLLPLSFRLRLFCAFRGIPFHFWLEKPLPTSGFRKFIRPVIWTVTIPFAKSIFCIGNEAVKAYGTLSRRAFNLPYSIDSRRYFERSSVASKPIKFLYIGQYIRRKGVVELLDAFVGLNLSQASLTLIGSGELSDRVKKYTLTYENIYEIGFVNPDQLPEIISQFDVLLCPSHHDGWAVVVVEAMLSGLPVISTSQTGAFMELTDIAKNKRIGTFCEVNVASIREAMMYYVNNPEKVLDEGRTARVTVLQSLAESKNAAQKFVESLRE